MTVDRHLHFSGRVQGVGFRYTVKQIATGFEVTGWVRNLTDGRVELSVRGESSQVEQFLQAIGESHLQHHIREQQEAAAVEDFDPPRSFEIRH